MKRWRKKKRIVKEEMDKMAWIDREGEYELGLVSDPVNEWNH